MSAIAALLRHLARHGSTMLPLGLLAGLCLPPVAALLRPALAPVVLALLTCVLLRIDFAAVVGYARRPALIGTITLWVLVLSPVLVDRVTTQLPLAPGVSAAIVLMSAVSPMMSAPAFARILGLDGPLTLVVAVLATMLMPFSAPPMVLGLIGLRLNMSALEFTLRLGLVVGSPLLAAVVLRFWLGAERLARRGREIDGGIVLLLGCFALGIMDGVGHALLARPAFVLGVIGTAFIANLGLNAAGALAFAWAGPRTALTVGLVSGNRQMVQMIAALPVDADPEIFLYFALAQLPFYLNPWVLAPVCRLLLGPARPTE
ncbi:MAG: hypothetical protein IT557_04275 [Alphaproteobacteria bacterium]|nr:hypothetical protein [Alphaproteobacteria bacterium]